MSEKEGKIKIKRSDGRVQYVTRDELEDLNFQRKSRDQAMASAQPNSPLSRLITLCGFAIVVAIAILWF